MSKQLTINGVTFNYPSPGENPDWGEAATDWAEAVTDALSGITVVGDISPTLVSIDNNIAVAQDVSGLSFDSAIIRSAIVEYFVFRSTSTTEQLESGSIVLIYSTDDNEWRLSQMHNGESLVVFTITPSGQMQYTSNNMSGASYSGRMRFRARALEI